MAALIVMAVIGAFVWVYAVYLEVRDTRARRRRDALPPLEPILRHDRTPDFERAVEHFMEDQA